MTLLNDSTLHFLGMGNHRVAKTLDTLVGSGVTSDCGAQDHYWYPAHEAFSS